MNYRIVRWRGRSLPVRRGHDRAGLPVRAVRERGAVREREPDFLYALYVRHQIMEHPPWNNRWFYTQKQHLCCDFPEKWWFYTQTRHLCCNFRYVATTLTSSSPSYDIIYCDFDSAGVCILYQKWWILYWKCRILIKNDGFCIKNDGICIEGQSDFGSKLWFKTPMNDTSGDKPDGFCT